MDQKKRERLEWAGWKVGSTKEFLGLSDAEAEYVELKSAMARALSDRRRSLRLTQTIAAKRVGSSQSRLAKMESADASVSLDLLVRSLLRLGASRDELAKVMISANLLQQLRSVPFP